MIIHTHNGVLFELHSLCVRVYLNCLARKCGMRMGKKTNRVPLLLFMVFFVHVDLLRCPSPVPLPPPLTTTTKTTFMKFALLFISSICCWTFEWRPCPSHFKQIKSKWNKRKYAINMRSRWKVIRCGLFCCYCVCVWVLNPFMCGDNRFCCHFFKWRRIMRTQMRPFFRM